MTANLAPTLLFLLVALGMQVFALYARREGLRHSLWRLSMAFTALATLQLVAFLQSSPT